MSTKAIVPTIDAALHHQRNVDIRSPLNDRMARTLGICGSWRTREARLVHRLPTVLFQLGRQLGDERFVFAF
jgi:hypothetical protein